MPNKMTTFITAIIECLDKKYTHKDPEYATIFEGPEYPQEKEVPQIKTLCEVVRDNYICIDPLDRSDKKFQEREKKCNEILSLVK